MNKTFILACPMKFHSLLRYLLPVSFVLVFFIQSCSRETTRAQRKADKALAEAELKEQQALQQEYDLALKNHWTQQSDYALKMNKSTEKQARKFNKSFKRKGRHKCF